MTPYFDDGQITIYCADSYDFVFANLQTNLVLTDPPYGIGKIRGGINKRRDKNNYVSDFVDNPNYIKNVIVPIINKLITLFPSVIVTPGNKNFCFYPQPVSFGAFYQPASVGLQTFGNADAQPIFYYGKNITKKNMGVPCSYVLTEHTKGINHPCPKPEKAWGVLLSNFSNEGDTILDPFNGSGTTTKMAQQQNRRAIGIELSEEYCQIAVERLSHKTTYHLPEKVKRAKPIQLSMV